MGFMESFITHRSEISKRAETKTGKAAPCPAEINVGGAALSRRSNKSASGMRTKPASQLHCRLPPPRCRKRLLNAGQSPSNPPVNPDSQLAMPADAALPARSEHDFRYWSWWLLVFVAIWAGFYFYFAPEPVALFQKNWIFIFVGVCGALLGNISAVGGGIVFIPVMIFIFNTAPVSALKIALASQSLGMTSGAIGWIQKKVVPLDVLKLTVPGLIVGSTISTLVIHPSAILVKGLFGPVSIFLGLMTLILSKRGSQQTAAWKLPKRATIPVIAASCFGGLITGWVAIGEGEIIAALLMLVYGLNVASCIGLGVVLLSINSIYLALLHQFVPHLGGIPWDIAAFTGLGCVFGARLAPYLSRRSNPIVLKSIFAAIAIGDGTLFIVQFLLNYFKR
jgi:uncharacterized membrane protein YfcA